MVTPLLIFIFLVGFTLGVGTALLIGMWRASVSSEPGVMIDPDVLAEVMIEREKLEHLLDKAERINS